MKNFGYMFEEVGSTTQDLLLKTRGNIKVQIGKRFIDLIKNGKIDIPETELFSVVDSIKEMDSDGVYLYDGNLYFKNDETLIKIQGEIVKQDSK